MDKKKYVQPEIRKVELEDRRVVAMAACNPALQDGGRVEDGQVVGVEGNPLLQYDPSL